MAERDDRVLTTTRVLCLAIVPFLLVAFVVLFLFPDRTDDHFAWTIRPRMTPMMLGAVYLGGAYYFARAARAREWHRIAAGLVPVTVFATMLGITTVVHWDKFDHGHVAFWLWAGLYFGAPGLVFAAWLANQRHRPPRDTGDGPLELPRPARLGIAGLAVLATATSLLLFLWPAQAISWWPWALTPLTSRVMGALFALGIGGFLLAADGRWSATKLLLEVEMVMLALIVVAGIASRDDFLTDRPLTYMFLAGFTVTLVASVALYARMTGRERADDPTLPDHGSTPPVPGTPLTPA